MNASQAQGVLVGSDGKQTNNFFTIVHVLVDVAKKREPEHAPDDDHVPPPWWLQALTWLVTALREVIMTLWAPIARWLANRPSREASRKTARGRTAAPRGRKRSSPAAELDDVDTKDVTPTKPWTAREVVGVFFWIGICLVTLAQCQPFGVAPASPPDGSVQLSDTFDSGSPAWGITSTGHQSAPVPLDGTLPLKSANGAASVAGSSAMTTFDGTDAIIEVDIIHIEGEGQYGIRCRQFQRGGRDNYYEFAIRDDGYVGIFKSHENMAVAVPLVYWRPASTLSTQEPNRLVAQCRKVPDATFDQVQLSLWINGELVASTSDYSTPLLRGTIALFTQANEGQTHVATFDNLTIKRPREDNQK